MIIKYLKYSYLVVELDVNIFNLGYIYLFQRIEKLDVVIEVILSVFI